MKVISTSKLYTQNQFSKFKSIELDKTISAKPNYSPNYNYYPNFKSNFEQKTNNNYELCKLINKEHLEDYSEISPKEEETLTTAIPVLSKNNFSKEDYSSLTEYEKHILRTINNKEFLPRKYKTLGTESINSSFNNIYKLSKDLNNYFSKNYPNCKIIGIGRSPDPIMQIMKELGTDTTTIPFSTSVLSGNFPHTIKGKTLSKDDWINYLKNFGLDKDEVNNSDKKIIITDFVHSGKSLALFTQILYTLGFDRNKIELKSLQNLNSETRSLDPHIIDYSLSCSHWKKFAKLPSAKNANLPNHITKTETFKESPQTLTSKLFSFALYDALNKD